MAATNDLRQLRKKKKRKSLFKKIIIVLCLVLVFFTGYITKDKWLPVFDGIVYKIQHIITKEDFSKNFPIKTGTSSEYELYSFKDKLVLLTDTKYTVYDRDGKVARTTQHTMTSPIIKIFDERMLIYDMGGSKLRVESRSDTVYTKNFSEKIIYAKLGYNGYLAVVTSSDVNACEMTVFDSKGKKVFFSSLNQKILDITFSKNSKGCYVSTMSAKGGQFVTKQYSFNFKKDKEQWISNPVVNLVLHSALNSSGNIVLVGDVQYDVMSPSGALKYSYVYPSQLIDYSVSDNITALILQNSQRRMTECMIFDKSNNQKSIKINGEFKKIHIHSNKIYLLCNKTLEVYSSDGKLITKKDLGEYYTDFAIIDEHMYLLGSQKIDIIKL